MDISSLGGSSGELNSKLLASFDFASRARSVRHLLFVSLQELTPGRLDLDVRVDTSAGGIEDHAFAIGR